MTKLSRYILIFITITTCAIALSELYWIAFDTPIRVPLIYYSCEIDDHTIFDREQNTYKDTHGNTYTQEEYERLLPLRYTKQLTMDNHMPDSINGIAVDLQAFAMARSYSRIKPTDFQKPQAKLFPLFESASGRANLEYPNDVFRINQGIEFIYCNTNTINKEKSKLFTSTLKRNGFMFPSKLIAGLPTTHKDRDDGYFITDTKNQLFHLKMVQGLPFVKRIDLPAGLQFKHMACTDHKDLFSYGYLLGNDGGIYILKQDDYQLIKIPIDDYIAEEHKLRISCDFFNYMVNIESDHHIKSYAFDKAFNLCDIYEYTWTPRHETRVGKIEAAIFPFSLSLKSDNSAFIKVYPRWYKGYLWLIINGLFVFLHLYITRCRKAKNKQQFGDVFLVLTTGIYGFIAVTIFLNNLD